jgi:hypothetical protein
MNAKIVTDDRKLSAHFDIFPYLVQATDKQIRILGQGGCKGECLEDAVEFLAKTDPELKKILDYCTLVDDGYEAEVLDPQDVGTWIENTRPQCLPADQLLEMAIEDMAQEDTASELQAMVGILLLDNDHQVGAHLSKSKHLDDDHIERLRELAIRCIKNPSFFQE